MKKVISIFTLILLVSTVSSAQEGSKKESSEQNSGQEQTVSRLDLILTLKSLSPEKRKMLEAAIQKEEQAMKPMLEKLSLVKKQIQKGTKAAIPEVGVISRLIDDKHEMEATLEKSILGFETKMLRGLTDEQRIEFEEKKNEGK